MKRSGTDTSPDASPHSQPRLPPSPPPKKKKEKEEEEAASEEGECSSTDAHPSKQQQQQQQKHDPKEVAELLTRLTAIFREPSTTQKKYFKACEACSKAVEQGLIKGPQSELWFKLLCAASDRYHKSDVDKTLDDGWKVLVGAATSFKAMEAGSLWSDDQRCYLDSWFFEMNTLQAFEESDDALSFGKPATEVRAYIDRFADAVSSAMVTSSNTGMAKEERDQKVAQAGPPEHFVQVLFHVLDAVSAMSVTPERLLWARTPSVQLLQYAIDKGSVMWSTEQSERLEEFKSRVSDANSGSSSKPGLGLSLNRFDASSTAWKHSNQGRPKKSGKEIF